MLAAPDVDVDVFRSQIADMGNPHPQFTLFVSRDDRALAVSRRVWGNIARLGSVDPEQEPYKSEFAANKISVIDLTEIKAGDDLHHSKFAESPQIVQLIGARLSDGQTLTDSRVGLGDRIVEATAGVATVAGTAAGLAVAAPVAVIDQNTRENFGQHVNSLGTGLPTVPAAGRPAATSCNETQDQRNGGCNR
jgi:esterase/lipase superfamily enzyme